MNNVAEAAQKIKLLALDVDGVLTDGTLFIGNAGELCKAFNAKDGMAISCALRSGLKIVIITGRSSQIVHKRALELGIKEVLENIKDKKKALEQVARKAHLEVAECAYMGDDLNDLSALMVAGFACAPADAAAEVLERVDFITEYKGGHGAVRQTIEFILKAQGLWETVINYYLNEGQGDSQ